MASLAVTRMRQIPTECLSVSNRYAKAHFKLGALSLFSGDKSSALDEFRILKDLDKTLTGCLPASLKILKLADSQFEYIKKLNIVQNLGSVLYLLDEPKFIERFWITKTWGSTFGPLEQAGTLAGEITQPHVAVLWSSSTQVL